MCSDVCIDWTCDSTEVVTPTSFAVVKVINLTGVIDIGDDDGCELEITVVERWCCWWLGGGDDGCGLEMMVVEGWCGW
nr:hypothetical protein [Tanacetum cinerariifolium]